MKTINKEEGAIICLNKQETEELKETGYVLCSDGLNRCIVTFIDGEYEVWTETKEWLGIRLNCKEEEDEE